MILRNRGFEGIAGNIEEHSTPLFAELYDLLKSLEITQRTLNTEKDEFIIIDVLEELLECKDLNALEIYTSAVCDSGVIINARVNEVKHLFSALVKDLEDIIERSIPLTDEESETINKYVTDIIGRLAMLMDRLYELDHLAQISKIEDKTEVSVGAYNFFHGDNDKILSGARNIRQIYLSNLPSVSIFDTAPEVGKCFEELYPQHLYDLEALRDVITLKDIKSVLNCDVDIQDFIIDKYRELLEQGA